jgi:hypothetical protein
MKSFAEKSQDKKNQAGSRQGSKQSLPAESSFAMADNRPQTAQLQTLQEDIAGSPQVSQLMAHQLMADRSPQVSQLERGHPSAGNPTLGGEDAATGRVGTENEPVGSGVHALQFRVGDESSPIQHGGASTAVVQRNEFTEEQMAAFSAKQIAARNAELGAVSKGIQNRQNNGFLNEQQEGEAASSFQEIYDGSLSSLAEALFAHPAGAKALNDAQLIEILKVNFESNWFKAKKCLTTDVWPGVTGTRPPHESSIVLMQALVNMRGRVWDKFVGKHQAKIKAAVEAQKSVGGEFANLKNPEKFNDNFGLKESVGSESVTSDIDLSAKGENTEIGVAMINAAFNKEFGTEPGAFFDINVYSSDWMFKPTEIIEDKVVKKTPTSEAKTSTGRELSAANQKKKDDKNEVWAMVKIRRNMEGDDWETYKTQLLSSITSPAPESLSPQQLQEESAQRAELISKFADVDTEYTTFHNTVAREVARMKEAVTHEENRQRSAFEDRNGQDHLAEEGTEMAASNRQYEKIILQVKGLRLQIKRLNDENQEGNRETIEELLLQVHDGVARGLTYANEVYATEGAVLHTVFGNQGAKKELKERKEKGEDIVDVQYLLTKEQYLQSLHENVGDSLHSLNHNAQDPQYAVYRAGKYLARLCDAADNLVTKDVAIGIPGYATLLEIGAKSVLEKDMEAGKDPLAVRNANSFFSQYEAGDLSVVKSLTIGLGAKAAAIYKKSKQ